MVVKSNNPSDLAYLEELLKRNPEYQKILCEPTVQGFAQQYNDLDRNTMYFKIGKDWSRQFCFALY